MSAKPPRPSRAVEDGSGTATVRTSDIAKSENSRVFVWFARVIHQDWVCPDVTLDLPARADASPRVAELVVPSGLVPAHTKLVPPMTPCSVMFNEGFALVVHKVV